MFPRLKNQAKENGPYVSRTILDWIVNRPLRGGRNIHAIYCKPNVSGLDRRVLTTAVQTGLYRCWTR